MLIRVFHINPDLISSFFILRVPRVHSLYVAKSRKDKLATQVMYCSCFKDKLVGSSTDLSEEANCKWQESLPLCQPLNWKENKCQINGKRQTDDDLEIDVPFDIVDFTEGPKVRLRPLNFIDAYI
jgi:hypothetical protein